MPNQKGIKLIIIVLWIKTVKVGKTIITDNKTYWYISCDGGLLQIIECQVEGKKQMNVKEFLNGFRNLNEWIII